MINVMWWGSPVSGQGTTVQIGIDMQVASTQNTDTVTLTAYLSCSAGWVSDSYNKLVFYGEIAQTFTNVPVNIKAGQQIQLGQVSKTFTKQPGVEYSVSFGVRLEEFQTGTPSMVVTHIVRPMAYQVPARPAFYVTRQSDNQVALSWSVTSTSEAPISSFTIQRCYNALPWETIATLDGQMRNWIDTAAPGANTVINYQIRANGPGGASPWNLYEHLYMTPGAPASVVGRRDGTNIILEWVNTAVGPAQIEIWEGSTKIATLNPGTTTYTVVNAAQAAAHTYRLRALLGGLVSDFTSSNTVIMASAPLAPTELQPSGQNQPKGATVNLVWRHNPTDTSGQTQFEVQYRFNGAASWTSSGVKTATSSTFALTVGSNSSCEWQVRTTGQDKTKWSPWSNTAAFTIVDRPSVQITSPPTSSTVNSSMLTVEFTSSPTVVFWQATATATGYSQSKTGSSTSPHRVTFTGIPNKATVSVNVTVRTTVDSLPVSRSFTVSYSPPSTPSGSAVWDTARGSININYSEGPLLTGGMETVKLRVLRVDGTGETLVYEDSRPGTTTGQVSGVVTDGLPSLTGAAYVIEAVSKDGATARTRVESGPLQQQAQFLNWGPQAGKVLKVTYNPTLAVSADRQTIVQTFAGHTLPRAVFAEQCTTTYTVGGLLVSDPGLPAARQAQAAVSDLALTDSPVVLRTFDGMVQTGYVSAVKLTRNRWRTWEFSCTHTQAEL
ncbi:hypothetical protein [Trueperella sp. LYQ141]|uniref:hypothetical protein n=1 Tax=Trueperella sp. LYQ141 TaxID=3391058 RepID=UPI00398393DD